MKKTLLTNLAFLVVAIVAAVGISFVSAATQADPSCTAPDCNTVLPINVGQMLQVKPSDPCDQDGCGGIAILKSFLANQGAAFNAQTFIGGLMLGGTAGKDGPLTFGSAAHPTALQVSGDMQTTGAMLGNTLKNTAGNHGICSNTSGQIVLCSVDLCSNIAGNQYTIPAGASYNKDGTCSVQTKTFWSVVSDSYGGLLSDEQYLNHAVTDGDDDRIVHSLDARDIVGAIRGYGSPLMTVIRVDNLPTNSPDKWIRNEIDTVSQANWSPESRLIDVKEKGSYKFHILSIGRYGIKGIDDNTNNFMGLNFFLVINEGTANAKWIPLSTKVENKNALAEEYPTTGVCPTRTVMGRTAKLCDIQFFTLANSACFPIGECDSGAGNGDKWHYAYYDIDYRGTYSLNPGDTVSVKTVVYGMSHHTGFNNSYGVTQGHPQNFSYHIESVNTLYKVVETVNG